VIAPLTSALFVAGVGIYQLPHLGWRVSLLCIGTFAIGAVPLCYYRRRSRRRFSRDEGVS
jgi:hypothetical protein